VVKFFSPDRNIGTWFTHRNSINLIAQRVNLITLFAVKKVNWSLHTKSHCTLLQVENYLNLKKKIVMAISKKQVIETINAMPEEEFEDIDVLLERIMVLEKIERAEKNIAAGEVYTTEEAKHKLPKWLQ